MYSMVRYGKVPIRYGTVLYCVFLIVRKWIFRIIMLISLITKRFALRVCTVRYHTFYLYNEVATRWPRDRWITVPYCTVPYCTVPKNVFFWYVKYRSIFLVVRFLESMHRISIDASILHQRCINKDYYPVDQRCIDYRADKSMMHRLSGRQINDASIIWSIDQWCIDYLDPRSMMHRLSGPQINDASIIWSPDQWCIDYLAPTSTMHRFLSP